MNILHGYQVASQVIELIQTTEPGKPLVLASAYFRPWGALDNALRNALVADKIPVIMIVRGGDVLAKNIEATRPYAELGAQVGFVARLHAKFFINDQEAIIGSLNLVESSAVDSWEMAVRLGVATDNVAFMELKQGYAALRKQATQEMARSGLGTLEQATELPSAPTAATSKKPAVKVKAKAKVKVKAKAKATTKTKATTTTKVKAKALRPRRAKAAEPSPGGAGHCIRCSTSIPLKADRPHCRACWSAWSKYSNEDYGEKYCHACGKKHESTKAKPLCKPCWRKQAS